jgi:hypothetical protein
MGTIGVKFVVGLFAFSASLAFATTNACPTGTNGAGLPAAGSVANNNLITSGSFPGGAGADGTCFGLDLTFSNFSVSAVNNLNNSAYVFQAGGAGNNPITSPITMTFSSERGAAGADAGNNDNINNFSTNATTALLQNLAYVVTASGGDQINQVKVSFGGVGIDANGAGSATINVCEGLAVSGNFASGNCTGAGTHFFTTTINLATTTSLTIALTGSSTIVSINAQTALTGHNGGNISSFLTMTDEFDQIATGVPEPATFTLFGTALVGIGFLRHRRKKS